MQFSNESNAWKKAVAEGEVDARLILPSQSWVNAAIP